MSWLDYVQVLWPIASVVTPVLIGAGLLWLRSQFTLKSETAAERARSDKALAEKATEIACDVKANGEKIANHEMRIALIEADQKRPPSRHELFTKMSDIAGRTESMESTLEGLTKHVGTLNEYLHTLIERGLDK